MMLKTINPSVPFWEVTTSKISMLPRTFGHHQNIMAQAHGIGNCILMYLQYLNVNRIRAEDFQSGASGISTL